MTSIADRPAVDSAVVAALDRAVQRLLALETETGWWKGELETNVTMDVVDLFLRQFLGIRIDEQTQALAEWIRSQQRHRRHVLPRPEAEERQPNLVKTRSARCRLVEHVLAREAHVLGVERVACEA